MPDPDGWTPLLPPLAVYPNDEPDFSGLLDARGYPLVRHREPIGFKLSSAAKAPKVRVSKTLKRDFRGTRD